MRPAITRVVTLVHHYQDDRDQEHTAELKARVHPPEPPEHLYPGYRGDIEREELRIDGELVDMHDGYDWLCDTIISEVPVPPVDDGY